MKKNAKETGRFFFVAVSRDILSNCCFIKILFQRYLHKVADYLFNKQVFACVC